MQFSKSDDKFHANIIFSSGFRGSYQCKLEIVDQWSTRIPSPVGGGSSGQCADYNWTLFEITRLLFTHAHRQYCWSLDLKFKAKPKLESRNWNIQCGCRAAVFFLKWHHSKSKGFYPYIQVMCYWSLDLIFKAILKLESGNQKIQYGCQVAIPKVIYLKINRLLPMATNMHMKFEI